MMCSVGSSLAVLLGWCLAYNAFFSLVKADPGRGLGPLKQNPPVVPSGCLALPPLPGVPGLPVPPTVPDITPDELCTQTCNNQANACVPTVPRIGALSGNRNATKSREARQLPVDGGAFIKLDLVHCECRRRNCDNSNSCYLGPKIEPIARKEITCWWDHPPAAFCTRVCRSGTAFFCTYAVVPEPPVDKVAYAVVAYCACCLP